MIAWEYVERGMDHVAKGEALAISIAGMLTVFFALGLIAAAIALLPKVLQWVARFLPEKADTGHGSAVPATVDDSMIAAIAYILHRRTTGES